MRAELKKTHRCAPTRIASHEWPCRVQNFQNGSPANTKSRFRMVR